MTRIILESFLALKFSKSHFKGAQCQPGALAKRSVILSNEKCVCCVDEAAPFGAIILQDRDPREAANAACFLKMQLGEVLKLLYNEERTERREASLPW